MTTIEDRRADVLRRVRGLLDNADSYESMGNSEAAQSYRDKADAMIAKHTIDEFELMMAGGSSRSQFHPEKRAFDYGEAPAEIKTHLVHLFGDLARHCGVLFGEYYYHRAVLVGYPEDLDYLELLFTSVRLHMSGQIRPTPRREMGYDACLAMLKESGLKWREVYLKLLPLFPEKFTGTVAEAKFNKDVKKRMESHRQWHDDCDGIHYLDDVQTSHECIHIDGHFFMREVPRPIGVRFTKEYTEFCNETGRERIYSDPQVWARSFVLGYVDEVQSRILSMRRAREQATEGKGLVMVSMQDTLKEALYEFFPDKRPHAPDCDCDRCHRCSNPKCKRTNCVNARKPVRYRSVAEQKISDQAVRAGRRAGATADLSGGRNNLDNDRKGIE